MIEDIVVNQMMNMTALLKVVKTNDQKLSNTEGSEDAEADDNFDQTRKEGYLHDYKQTTNEVSNRAVNKLRKVVPEEDDKITYRLDDQDSEWIEATVIIRGGKSTAKINSILMFAEKVIKSKGFIWIELNLK